MLSVGVSRAELGAQEIRNAFYGLQKHDSSEASHLELEAQAIGNALHNMDCSSLSPVTPLVQYCQVSCLEQS